MTCRSTAVLAWRPFHVCFETSCPTTSTAQPVCEHKPTSATCESSRVQCLTCFYSAANTNLLNCAFQTAHVCIINPAVVVFLSTTVSLSIPTSVVSKPLEISSLRHSLHAYIVHHSVRLHLLFRHCGNLDSPTHIHNHTITLSCIHNASTAASHSPDILANCAHL